ncbi:WG repeat-containing protein [uncultured Microscilla sp.]|uniref:WG repeat-containing protein n=1 Tax=uncultured Microscilla sp. TaxID=432653 RepID=UPI0026348188|nr:WG repeat-containing protein [uncultured Microscilla sp.]
MKNILLSLCWFALLPLFVQCGGAKTKKAQQLEETLDKANSAWAKNDYKNAQIYYTQAAKLNPKDVYIQKRLTSIDSILANQKLEKKPMVKKILPVKEYDFEDSFYGGFAKVKQGDKWGYINREKQEIAEPQYDEAAHFSHGFARVSVKDKYGFIDTSGKEIVKPIKYEQAGKFGKEGLAFVMKEDKYGYVDTTGKEVIELKYDWAGNFSEDRAKVSLGNKFGFVDAKGKEVIQLDYDAVRNFKDGVAAVWKQRKWGFVDINGKEVIPFKYDRAEDFRLKKYKNKYNQEKEEMLALVVLNGQTFFINKKGKCVVDCDEK